MKRWDYRVVRTIEKMEGHEEREVLTIHEIYYDEAGKPEMWCETPAFAAGSGDTAMVELRGDLQMFLGAIERPILNREELP